MNEEKNDTDEPFKQIFEDEPEFEEFKEFDTPYLETINNLDDTLLYPDYDAFWIQIFPELNLYRFIHHDEETEDIFEIDQEELYRPILLIHGFNSNHATWNWMIQQLWRDGFRNLFAMKMFSYMEGLDKLCDQLTGVIDRILSMLSEYNYIHIIAHSMGGMVSRYYLKQSKDRNPCVNLLVTLGSPLRGLFHWFKPFENLIIKMTQSFFPDKLATLQNFAPTKGLMKQINNIILADELYNVTMVNITGSLKKLGGGDGLFKSKPIYDMINLSVPANHLTVNKIDASYQIIQDLLYNHTTIFKIWLLYIELKTSQESDEKKIKQEIFFVIKRKDGTQQRYPTSGYIDLKGESLVPDEPFIVYLGSTLQKRRESFSIQIYRKGKIKSSEIKNQDVVIKLGRTKEMVDSIPIDIDNQIKFVFASNSYKLIHLDKHSIFG
ncbi:MAG: lipase family alpha/beta hydrolase [Candidatus Hodarchaeales archaeon]